MLTLALNPLVTNLLVVFFLLVCVAMILIVLIQRPQGGGLGGAFGAGGGTASAGQTAFGTKTGDVLTWATVSIFFIFLLTAIGLNFAARPDRSGAERAATIIDPEQQPAPERPIDLPAPPRTEQPGDGELPDEWPGDDAGDDDDDAPDIDPATAEMPA
ncbi:MAG: preprotein translocase subunit SecG [Phycisphaerales bacterium]|nr:preprotein translocase subunit SecG [Planctomycetota bacterium]MCH8508785.1 preprotein translocase subunit SecG [Phycisphaerales bacterium]